LISTSYLKTASNSFTIYIDDIDGLFVREYLVCIDNHKNVFLIENTDQQTIKNGETKRQEDNDLFVDV